MQIDLIAQLKGADEFLAAFEPRDATSVHNGVSLVFSALGNPRPADRMRMAEFLLREGATVAGTDSEGNTALHVLLGQVKHDPSQTTELVRDLLAAGVDPSSLNGRGVSAIQLAVNLKVEEEHKGDLYDLLLSRPGAPLDTPNSAGFTPRQLAQKLPHRHAVLEKMEQYDRGHD